MYFNHKSRKHRFVPDKLHHDYGQSLYTSLRRPDPSVGKYLRLRCARLNSSALFKIASVICLFKLNKKKRKIKMLAVYANNKTTMRPTLPWSSAGFSRSNEELASYRQL
jgi:hypothetical protein